MKFNFQRITTVPKDILMEGIRKHAFVYDLEVFEDGECLTFDVPSPFSQMNFAPYQLVDDGYFRVSSSVGQGTVLEYSIRSYRIWAVILLFLLIGMAMGYPLFVFLGFCCAIVLYLYLAHFFILKRLIE